MLLASYAVRHASGQDTSTIRLDSVGYPPAAPKFATIAVRDADSFEVRDLVTGNIAFRGRVKRLEAPRANAGELVVADFSDLRQPGTYQLVIPGGETSPPFAVADDVYNWPFYLVTRGMYLWRCSTAVSAEFAGQTFEHAACHLDDGLLDHAGGPPGQRRDGVGGWHDAGDYNKFVINATFTAGMLLTAWEHFGERLESLQLDLPESDNVTPDFLDEIRWELDWLLKMQADDGSVYHKLATIHYGPFILPEEEIEPRYFSAWSSSATASFAAVMAQTSRAFHPYDAEFSGRCLEAAEKSYAFLADHPDEHRPDQSAFKTSTYMAPDDDDRLWAAAELWETTGRPEYLRDFEQRVVARRDRHDRRARHRDRDHPPRTVDADWDWSHLGNLGVFTFLLSQRDGRDPAVVERVRGDAIEVADTIIGNTQRHSHGRPLGSRCYWGANGTVARLAMNLEVAYRLTADPIYRVATLDGLHYLFGRNPYGRSFVTGLGHAPPRFPHDRRSGGDDVDMPWPGYLVGGGWPQETDWRDVEEDYRTNETAINWNGALIYALAAWVEPRDFAASVERAQTAASSRSTDPTDSTQPAQ